MKQFSKYDEDKKIHELENVKLKLKMISKNSKSSKVSVDDYISNILGSGFNISKPMIAMNKNESQSAQNVQNDRISKSNGNEFNHSSVNISTNYNHKSSENFIETDFLSNLPHFYRDLITAVQSPTGDLDTQKIYTIFLTSGLSTETLGSIWSLINRTLPGRLTVLELSVGLAMIAFYQKQSYTNASNMPFSPISWETIIARGEFPLPNLSLNKSVNEPSGKELNKAYSVNQSKYKDISAVNTAKETENWADFTSFTSHGEEISKLTDIKEIKHDMEVQSISVINIENKPVDIQKQIFNQFSHWQNNIKPEIIHANDSLHGNSTLNGHSNQFIMNKTELPMDINKQSAFQINNSVKSNIDSDFGDFQLFKSDYQSNHPDPYENNKNQKIPVTDKYELFNSELLDPRNKLISDWLRCLNQCKKIIVDIVKVLIPISDSSIIPDIFTSEKGIILLSGITEIYRVTRNIKLSTSKTNILTSSKSLLEVFTDIEKYWNDFMLILPDDLQIDLQTRLSKRAQTSDFSNNNDEMTSNEICGVCLCLLDPDEGFLSHGLRRYHCPCANLWVNTLDLTLPGLCIPESVL